MSDTAGIGVLTAFAAGIVSFLSPCLMALVPGYVSYVAGSTVGGLPNGVIDTAAPKSVLSGI